MNKLEKQFHEESKGAWLPPYFDLQDQVDAVVAFSNWMVEVSESRHKTIMKQADKIGELVKLSEAQAKEIVELRK